MTEYISGLRKLVAGMLFGVNGILLLLFIYAYVRVKLVVIMLIYGIFCVCFWGPRL